MYQAGWSKQEIRVQAQGYVMHGYGQPRQRALGQETPLWARAVYLQDSNGQSLIFCCLDLGYITYAMRSGVVEQLRERMGKIFDETSLVLTCTHTHSGPGGCSHDIMYNLVTPGFVPDNLERVVAAAVAAILEAWQGAAPTELGLAEAAFAEQVPVAWNRSLRAYNRNPDVTRHSETETHLALNRSMQVLSLRRNGELQSLISLFGVHATCVSSFLNNYDGDNKGRAAQQTERRLQGSGAKAPVAIFAHATAGDVSPHYHGPGDRGRRRKLKGAAEYAYAEQNGKTQSDLALAIAVNQSEEKISGGIDAILSYVDFTAIKADPKMANGNEDAWTSEPCHGVGFFAGTPVDGPGIPRPLALLAKGVAQGVRKYRLNNLDKYTPQEQVYYHRLYSAQGVKPILLEAGRKRALGLAFSQLKLSRSVDPLVAELRRQAGIGATRNSAMVPTVLPLQIIIIGPLALLCCPGEFTTTAGQRLMQLVAERLRPRGVQRVLICTYCNDYMGYVTTQEEYQEQAYEGGHTIYGQWTLAAFQTRFATLAQELLQEQSARVHDRSTRPSPTPPGELALRSSLPVWRSA